MKASAVARPASGSAAKEDLRELCMEVQRNPGQRMQVVASWYDRVLSESGYERAETAMLVLSIMNARGEMDGKNVNVNISGGQVGVINLGQVQGNIEASVQVLSQRSPHERDVADAIRQLAESISGSGLAVQEKKEALEVVNSIATEAQKSTETRSVGMLKAALSTLPSMIATAKTTVELWDKISPLIRQYFGLGS